jgi:D-alanine-D-alanine ligase
MTSKKLRVAVLFGGKSAEHEVSLQSARNVINALDKEKYDIVAIGIDKEGRWLLAETANYLLDSGDPKLIRLNSSSTRTVAVVPESSGALMELASRREAAPIDVFFPVLHGPFGEDGSIQGLLKLANVPFVGAGVLGSAVSMDKDVMKRLFRDAGIPIADFVVVRPGEAVSFAAITGKLGSPVFVKPANLGSSVGVHKVASEQELGPALADAFDYDTKVLIEEAIVGREIECSVLGNEAPIASVPGEIVPRHEFYSYEAKYIDDQGAGLEIPAKLPEDIAAHIQDTAIKVFRVAGCEGMARVDFFLRPDGTVIVNEINTIPGFTSISMYPKMWEASGIPQPELLDRLIQLAIARFERDARLKTSR